MKLLKIMIVSVILLVVSVQTLVSLCSEKFRNRTDA